MVHYTDRVDASQLCGENSYWKQVTKLYTDLGAKLGNTGFQHLLIQMFLEMFLAAIVL